MIWPGRIFKEYHKGAHVWPLFFCKLHLMNFFFLLKCILRMKLKQNGNTVPATDSWVSPYGSMSSRVSHWPTKRVISDIYALTPIKSLLLSIYESQVARLGVSIVWSLCFDLQSDLGKSVRLMKLLCKRWNIHLSFVFPLISESASVRSKAVLQYWEVLLFIQMLFSNFSFTKHCAALCCVQPLGLDRMVLCLHLTSTFTFLPF